MSDIDFHRTIMGRRYYESTLPELVKQVARLADVLERIVERLPDPAAGQAAEPASPGVPAPAPEGTP